MTIPAGQYYAMTLAAMLASSLSFMGSTAVALAARKATRTSIYQRLILGMCLADAISSISIFIHPFLLPRYVREEGLLWASGNSKTCAAIGFIFVTAPLIVTFYSLYISAYFYLKVNYNINDLLLINKFERPARWIALILPLSLGVTGLVTQAYGPRVYHNVCSLGDCEIGKVDDCLLEQGLSWYLGWVQAALIALPSVAALILTILVYWAVRKRLGATTRFAFANHDTDRRRKQLLAVRTQALLYALAYWNSFFWYILFGILGGDDPTMLEKEGDPGYFALQLVVWLLFPLQGFINFLVYTRPRYLEWRMRNPHASFFVLLRKAIALEPVSALAHVHTSSNMTVPSSKHNPGSSEEEYCPNHDDDLDFFDDSRRHRHGIGGGAGDETPGKNNNDPKDLWLTDETTNGEMETSRQGSDHDGDSAIVPVVCDSRHSHVVE